jgi:aryl-alcohol dehydrogenase-like predicted oxidoreductase
MELNRRILGRTGLDVTEMGLGCYQITGEFGVHYDEAARILDYALDNGINFIDTAQMYGFGESEALVGQALKRHSDKEIYVSDKIGYIDRGVARASGARGYLDEVELKRTIKHSLWLLGRDRLEIFMIHEPDQDWWQFDYATGDSMVTSVLEELKKEGVIGAIGLGSWNSEVLAKLCGTGRFDVALNAGGINLFEQPMFKSLIPAAKKHNTGIVIGGVLGQGFNKGLLGIDKKFAQECVMSEDVKISSRGKKLFKLYELAQEAGIPILDLSLRFVLSFEDIHSHIPGARCVEHVKENIAICKKGPLPEDVVKAVIKIGRE